ncbi:MAG: lyase family protein [Candidatus Uhrbacteria bacterium]|nr:lyase family protein [Candidatus Uhrbacteria bacterium]
MARLWTDENKFGMWLKIELAVLKAREMLEQIPAGTYDFICSKTWMDESVVQVINRRDERIKHDLNAFIEIMRLQIMRSKEAFRDLFALPDDVVFHEVVRLDLAARQVAHKANFFHAGMTSYDTQEGAMSLIMIEACQMIFAALINLREALRTRAMRHRGQPMLFRTHGQDAQPGTFGLLCLTWLDLVDRAMKRLGQAQEEISVIKLSGAVGVFGTLGPDVEDRVAKALFLKPVISTQILPLDRKAHLMNTLAEVAAVLGKIEEDLWFLSQTAVGEIRESFGKDQKGSSAMPHKKNPIAVENGRGLAALVRGYAGVMLEQAARDRMQRVIDHSSVERMIFPDAFGCLLYVIERLTGVIENMEVWYGRMLENIEASYGTFASQEVAQLLIDKGMAAETAYRVVQEGSFIALEKRVHLKDLFTHDFERVWNQDYPANWEDARRLLRDEPRFATCFDLTNWTRHEVRLYKRMGYLIIVD